MSPHNFLNEQERIEKREQRAAIRKKQNRAGRRRLQGSLSRQLASNQTSQTRH